MTVNKEENSEDCASKICEYLFSELGLYVSDESGDLIQGIILNNAYEED